MQRRGIHNKILHLWKWWHNHESDHPGRLKWHNRKTLCTNILFSHLSSVVWTQPQGWIKPLHERLRWKYGMGLYTISFMRLSKVPCSMTVGELMKWRWYYWLYHTQTRKWGSGMSITLLWHYIFGTQETYDVDFCCIGQKRVVDSIYKVRQGTRGMERGGGPTCWGPSPFTMAGGGGEPSRGWSGLRSWPDSRGGVWSAMPPSFTPPSRNSWNTGTRVSTKNINSVTTNQILHGNPNNCKNY